MADAFIPFADDAAALTIGGLTIENGTDRISVSGSLDLARDRQALQQARALRMALDAIVAVLEAAGDLPAKAAPRKPAKASKAPNPFA